MDRQFGNHPIITVFYGEIGSSMRPQSMALHLEARVHAWWSPLLVEIAKHRFRTRCIGEYSTKAQLASALAPPGSAGLS